jgi:hypothetical protein
MVQAQMVAETMRRLAVDEKLVLRPSRVDVATVGLSRRENANFRFTPQQFRCQLRVCTNSEEDNEIRLTRKRQQRCRSTNKGNAQTFDCAQSV